MYKLPKRRILRQKGDFQRVYRLGKSYANHYLVIYVFRSNGNEDKVGFAAGKKLGNAVTRNRVKRLMRECFRLNQDMIKPGFTLLLVGRKGAASEKYEKIENKLFCVRTIYDHAILIPEVMPVVCTFP